MDETEEQGRPISARLLTSALQYFRLASGLLDIQVQAAEEPYC
jgi:hypothetical protein